MPSEAITSATPMEEVPTPPELEPVFQPFRLGKHELKHRIVYAPLTRCRAIGSVPCKEAAIYYGERATAGQFMLTEGTIIGEGGYGYPNVPGIHTQEQIEAWKPIVKAVHDKGAVFFCQIWHCGREVIAAYNKDGSPPIGPSPVAMEPSQKVLHPETFQECDPEVPREIKPEEMPGLAQMYADAAVNAIEKAGFDGVEIHGANGYLLDQFLKPTANKRTDEYGGSIENRARFPLMVVDAVIKAVGAERVGYRLSPHSKEFLSAETDTPYDEVYMVEQLSKRGLCYVHMIEPRIKGDGQHVDTEHSLKPFREAANIPFISAGGYTRDNAPGAISSGATDLVTMGRWALANPDLLLRWKLNAPLNKYDRKTFYAPDMKGYIDYPHLKDTDAGKELFADL